MTNEKKSMDTLQKAIYFKPTKHTGNNLHLTISAQMEYFTKNISMFCSRMLKRIQLNKIAYCSFFHLIPASEKSLEKLCLNLTLCMPHINYFEVHFCV